MHSSRMCTYDALPYIGAQGGCLPRGWVFPGGVSAHGCLPRGMYTPIDRITQACENITFLQLLMRMVIKCCSEIWPQFDATITICDINI